MVRQPSSVEADLGTFGDEFWFRRSAYVGCKMHPSGPQEVENEDVSTKEDEFQGRLQLQLSMATRK